MPPMIGRDGPAGYVPCYGSTAIQTVTVQTPEGGQVYFDLCRNVKERLGIGRRALLCVWIRSVRNGRVQTPLECGDTVPASPGFKTITEQSDYLSADLRANSHARLCMLCVVAP